MRCTIDSDRTLFAHEAEVEFIIEKAESKSSAKAEWMEVKLACSNGKNRGVVFDNVMSWEMAELMTAIGHPPTSKEFDVEPDDLVGHSGRCQLIVETYQGKDRNKVGQYLVAKNQEGDPVEIPF